MDNPTKTAGLDRYLSPMDVWAMAFGCMVGWGVFAMPGNTFLPVAGPAGTMISMGIGMCIMLVIGSNFSYLMQRTAVTGGVYSYTKQAFGRDHAFLSAWFMCLSYLTIVFLNGTALFYVVRILFGSTLQFGAHYTVAGNTIYLVEAAVSVLVLAAVGILFITAKPALQRLHTVLALVLFLGILITAVFCMPGAVRNGALRDFGISGVSRTYSVFSLVILAPWAFVGFEVTSFDTAHFRFPNAKTKNLLGSSIIAATLAYVAMAFVSVAAVPDGFPDWQAYVAGLDGLTGIASVPTFHAARSIMGPVGIVIMTLTAVAAILTGIIGGYRAATRVLSTMAEDKILSEKFSKTTYSILFIMGISTVLALLGRNTLNWFVDLTSFGAIVGFGYTSAAAWKLARMEGNRRTVITGMIGTGLSAVFIIVQIIPRLAALEAMGSAAFLMLSLWCLLGFVFYWRTVTYSTLTEYSGMSASGIVLFALLIYASLMWLAKRVTNMTDAADMKAALTRGSVVAMVIIFLGLVVMLYVQNLVRKKHEASEREKIRAVESSLAKSRFLFNMSHDIRTPMNAIIGYTKLTMQEDIPPAARDYLSKIDTSSRHLLSLINDILEMSRIESGKLELELEPCDLCGILEEARDLFAHQMEQKRIAFGVHTAGVRNRFVWCDKKNLNRILFNLLSNAYKFTPDGGAVTASVLEIGSDGDGYGSYELRVQDNGIGMSREFAGKMFNAFERERTSTVSGVQGTGLGLAITRSIVDLMGGTIEVITSPGSGTEMIIRLKMKLASPDEMPAEAPAKPESRTVDFTGKRLLLVEDNDINREIAAAILGQAGFRIETAENGREAVDTVSASEPGYYDAILMDIQMPVMDGYAATRAIRALEDPALAEIPIVAMTANAFKEDEEAAKAAGMQAHIAKPLDVDRMLQTLGEILSRTDRRGAV